ncbi:protein enabled isoform X1 [Danaus plexippus]|uniref:protein enabled isoform X1 n=1 Tax=Danaus plexippus TaxID=13037 RepID=UPI002AB1DE33|nr:protein enabled isoform X1 [Danaus plexippus]XP_061381050.1 protein enabled isoform X1 [Danaus plexippus]XP_061381051.1 protein enabled isoform X1 [Danaus plexippus]XP_061381052.1 protein enabled isoform X1 [Danaus plexippus]
MRRVKMNINPDLGDLEEMLAHVQTQIEREIDLEIEAKMPSVVNVQESPKMRRSSSVNKGDGLEYRRAPRPHLGRMNSDITASEHEYGQTNTQNGLRGSQTSLKSNDDTISQVSFQSFRSEPIQRHSVMSLPDKRESNTLNGRGKTATLPRGYGSNRDKNWEEYWAHEQSISSARASVMVYDDAMKRWIPSGSSSGLSKVHIYHHTQHNTFRVVGRKLNDHEVVINCGIVRGLKYNQATATFHQWRDARHVYGLNFSCREDADSFARAMMHTLEILANKVTNNTAPPAQVPNPPVPYNGHNTHYDEDMGYRTMTREDAAILQQPQYHAPQHQPHHQPPQHQPQQLPQQLPHQPQQLPSQYHAPHHHQPAAPPAPAPPPHAVHTLPHAPPHGHHRTNSAPMAPNMSLSAAGAPPPPPVPPHQNLPPPANGPIAPPTPPAATQPPPMQPAAPAPPPPPPPPGSISTPAPTPPAPVPTPAPVTPAPAPPPPPPPPAAGTDAAGLAAQLQQARLKRQAKQQQSSPSPAGGEASPPEAGARGNLHTMMHEMQRTLARRRAHLAHLDKNEESSTENSASSTPMKSWERSATLPHRLPNGNTPVNTECNPAAQSPRAARKRFGSASEETILKQVNGSGEGGCACGGAAEWDSFKQDVLREIRAQVAHMKKDILDAMKAEFARR